MYMPTNLRARTNTQCIACRLFKIDFVVDATKPVGLFKSKMNTFYITSTLYISR